MRWRLGPVLKCAVLLSAALALGTTPGFHNPRAASQEEQVATIATEVSNALLAIEDGLLESPRDRWDPQYVVDTVGADADALFAWVRREVRWVPYRGALRGPAGVLMDRRGNSLDQALLLADLLKKAGLEVRLARAELSEAAVDAALAARQSPTAALEPTAIGTPMAAGDPDPADPRAVLPQLPDVAEEYELDADAAEGLLANAATAARDLAVELDLRTAVQSARLLQLLGPEAAPGGAESGLARAALKDHWWVEADEGSGWTAYDPLAGEAPGATFAASAGTIKVEELPRELRHPVTLRVIGERLKDGSLQEQGVFEMGMLPSEVVGRPMVMSFYPMAWPGNWPTVTPDDIQLRLRAAVFTQREWMPLLTVGREQFAQWSVRDSGEVNTSPSPGNPYAEMGIPAAGLFVKAGDLLSAGEENAAAEAETPDGEGLNPDGELTAVWIEFQIGEPDGGTRRIRREVFDLIGAARRQTGSLEGFAIGDEERLARSMAMLGEARLLVSPAALSPDFLLYRTGEAILANGSLFEDLAGDPFGRAPANTVEVVAKFEPLPGPLEATAALRFDGSPVADLVYVERPVIMAEHGTLIRDARTGDFSVRSSIDILDNHVAVIPAVEYPYSVRLMQGVADTNAEALALRGKPGLVNAAEAYQQALASGAEWKAILPSAAAELAGIGLSADDEARIAAELQQGYAVVLPRAPAGDGGLVWWRIDPVTGAALGMGLNGQGVSMVEYALVLIAKQLLAQAACVILSGAVEASIEAVSTGRSDAGLPKNLEQAKATGKRLAASCISQAMLFQLTGITNAWFATTRWGGGGGLGRSPVGAMGSSRPGGGSLGPGAGPRPPSPPGVSPPNFPRQTARNSGANSPPLGSPPPGSPPPGLSPPPGSPPPGSRPPGNPPPAGQPGANQNPRHRQDPQPHKLGQAPAGEGPFQGDPANRQWLKENYGTGHPVAEALGDPAIYDGADLAAQGAYNRAINQGLGPEAARQASYNEWWNYSKQGRGIPYQIEGRYEIASGKGGKTIEMEGRPQPSNLAQTGNFGPVAPQPSAGEQKVLTGSSALGAAISGLPGQ